MRLSLEIPLRMFENLSEIKEMYGAKLNVLLDFELGALNGKWLQSIVNK